MTARKRSFTPPGVSVAKVSTSSVPPNPIGTGPAATASGIPVRSARLAARASWYPSAPGTTLSSPVSTPSRKPSASSSGRYWPRISSARAPGSSPSITNALATASRLNGTPGSGRPRRARLSGATIARRNASGSWRTMGTSYIARCRAAPPAGFPWPGRRGGI